ncbi:MAG: hypothetical protein GXY33_15245 [Phycisphaerae bacterium]|nr:hypothetical protein [Phycisphaerae bacterium]
MGEIQPNTTYTLAVDIGPSQYWNGLASTAGVEIGEFSSTGTLIGEGMMGKAYDV